MRSATWGLRPSAFRDDVFTALMPAQHKLTPATAAEQRHIEDYWAMEFASAADHHGFGVPGDRPELRDPRLAIVDYDPYEFPPINKLHIYALAQHYGIPTRLLDWTSKPLIAAYFAVEGLARLRAQPSASGSPRTDEPCAVWALDRGFVENVAHARDAGFSPGVIMVTAPRATNPNLAAQGGLFTVVQPRDTDPHPIPDIDEALRDNADRVPEALERHAPFLYKFVLPATEARTALRMLSELEVHAGVVYPGLRGVVEFMKEKKGYQWAGTGSRS
jgi:hypothetical protein